MKKNLSLLLQLSIWVTMLSLTSACYARNFTNNRTTASAGALVFDKWTLPPLAINDTTTATVGNAKRIRILANDSTYGTPLNVSSVVVLTNPLFGTTILESNGDITYIPIPGYIGTDNFQYQVQNASGLTSNTATVIINVVSAGINCNSVITEVDDAYPKHDLRGAWVATVSNIDWPSSRTLTTSQQQAGLTKILDTLASVGINTVYLQVRPECDALYQSSIEPWSYWLTNSQGTAPNPLWDPLQFAIDQAHARGMALHAWLNPYRAKQSTPTLAANHVAVLHPDWTFISGTLTMLNPGLPAVRDYVTSVAADIATRYNVDGIHFDDYFYPYSSMGNQDMATFATNNPTSIPLIADWRRNNVNMLIGMVYDTIQKINAASNRNIVFGVGPFGIWKSGTPAGISGTSSYSANYCDPIAWLQAGKVDYLAPQLYWKITGPQDYVALAKWWNDQAAANNRHLYPGLALYKADGTTFTAAEIPNQINVNRGAKYQQTLGQVLYSTTQIMNNLSGVKAALEANQFLYKAYPPPMPWKDAICPNPPTNVHMDVDTLKWDTPIAAADGETATKYVVYHFANLQQVSSYINDGKKVFAIVAGNKVTIPASEPRTSYFVVTALDKNNNESMVSTWILLPLTGLTLDVVLNGDMAIINWSTQSEANTNTFEVEESSDGVHFTHLTDVVAAGNSSICKKYRAVDPQLFEGYNYYRIKAIDMNGTYTYSSIKYILYKTNKANIVAAPNPFKDAIRINNLKKAVNVYLMDVCGRVLLRKNVTNLTTASLPANNLPTGMYYLKITQVDGTTEVIKMIKEE